MADRLAARGIVAPFPIQAMCLPDALAGRDICGKAPTGSGKTLAFGIPLVAGLATRRARPKRPRALVLVPTRELAAQVSHELGLLAATDGPTVATFYGGMSYGPQIAALRRGVDIAVACPGRLADLIQRGDIRLDQIEVVVIDEADRMADMGFLPVVRDLLDQIPGDRQTLLFSATLDGDVDVLVRRYQRDPVRHDVAVDDEAPQNRHIFWKVDRHERVDLTANLVGRQWPAIIFTRTKHGADRLTKQLLKRGVSAAVIHGDRSQAQRERALSAFVATKVQALVATDVAARGIHVDRVAAVVHYDLPASEKDYIHRSGRTGRAGVAGLVVSLVDATVASAAEKLQRALGFAPVLHRPQLEALADARHDAEPTPALSAVATAPRAPRARTHRRPAHRRRPTRNG